MEAIIFQAAVMFKLCFTVYLYTTSFFFKVVPIELLKHLSLSIYTTKNIYYTYQAKLFLTSYVTLLNKLKVGNSKVVKRNCSNYFKKCFNQNAISLNICFELYPPRPYLTMIYFTKKKLTKNFILCYLKNKYLLLS